jgi:hypothetical protein
VRGPTQSVQRGKTPVLAPDEARRLLDAIDVTTPAGLRGRAPVGLMVYRSRGLARRWEQVSRHLPTGLRLLIDLIKEVQPLRSWPTKSVSFNSRGAQLN